MQKPICYLNMTVGVCVLSNICEVYITTNMSELFYAHPDWQPNGSIIDRKIKVDMEAGYQSGKFREFCHTLGYRIESSSTRDKHAHGVGERSVGNIITKANIAMLGNITPQTFWSDAILYACHCELS